LLSAAVKSVGDVHNYRENLIGFSDAGLAHARELKSFLLENLYRHARLIETNKRSRKQLRELYQRYEKQPTLMPKKYITRLETEPGWAVIRDYIAGMTDRFAEAQHRLISAG
jgi:dGTPase